MSVILRAFKFKRDYIDIPNTVFYAAIPGLEAFR
jgi:hypothetical protein